MTEYERLEKMNQEIIRKQEVAFVKRIQSVIVDQLEFYGQGSAARTVECLDPEDILDHKPEGDGSGEG